jgi:hypothetical protein
MPYEDPDATDPMLLNAVGIETAEDRTREMAACFIEEFLRMGFDADRMLHLFRTKGYAGPHLAYRKLGEPAIQAMIDAQVSLRGGRPRPDPLVQRNARGEITLSVLA